ncbi:MAG: protoheme IX farnesyltransferase [Deltaproteobacteria bacterium]|nr:MAG: protoheme IX farnesyltransferase [Deltaproteobacteria bacterium]TMA60787.1 MAG: protoheme IX farnesyltransferase [Deltaproteobacteria bacterium]
MGDYLELGKPRVVLMVLVTTVVGYYLGSTGTPELAPLLETLVGTALAAAGTLALNQLMERDLDARMARTRHRPLPDGRLRPGEALVFGVALLAAGLAHLALVVGPLPAAVTATIAIVYLLLYTPLKRVTPLCSLVGAVPGALPPVAGWAAARGTLGLEPWILFAIMFFWQIPHSLAIARLYRDDYARAGIRLLPVVDLDGSSTGTQVVAHCLALLPVALLPTLVHLAGAAYFVVALVLGLAFLWSGIMLARGRSAADARRLMLASLVYLPALLAVMALDKLSF